MNPLSRHSHSPLSRRPPISREPVADRPAPPTPQGARRPEWVVAPARLGVSGGLRAARDASRLRYSGARGALQADQDRPPPPSSLVTVSPSVLDPSKAGLFGRESVSMDSLRALSCPVPWTRLLLTESDSPQDGFETVRPPRSSRDVGDPRGTWLLSDCLAAALDRCWSDDCVVFYHNSDCAVRTLDRVLDVQPGRVLCMRRRDFDSGSQWGSVSRGGADGLAMRASTLRDILVRGLPSLEFYLGEPYWDVAVTSCLELLGMADSDTWTLAHPRHGQGWDPSKLSPAGEHNKAMYLEMLDAGLLRDRELSCPPRATVVVAHWGSDPDRLRAIREASDSWALQDVDAEWVLAEACLPGVETNLPWLSGPPWRRVRLELGANCEGVWQKEALLNAGIRASSSPVVVLLDSDVYSGDPAWLSRLCDACRPGVAVQGFSTVEDSLRHGEVMHRGSVSILGTDCDSGNPGMAWAFDRGDLEADGILNDLCCYGSGDSMLASEYCGDLEPELSDWTMTHPRFSELRRDLPRKLRASCLPDRITHANHGGGRGPHHSLRHLATAWLSGPIAGLLERLPGGLVAWRDPSCPERSVLCPARPYRSRADVVKACSAMSGTVTASQGVMLSIVTASYDTDAPRLEAYRAFVAGLLAQRSFDRCELVCVEAHFGVPALAPLLPPNARHETIPADDACRGFFQKEALMNVGWRMARSDAVLFLDGDVSCPDTGWLEACRRAFDRSGACVTQPFRVVRDTLRPDLYSYASRLAGYSGFECDLPRNPGIAALVPRPLLEANGGLNALHPYGTGDSAFLWEYPGSGDPAVRGDDWCVTAFPRVREALRELRVPCGHGYLPYDLTHHSHGGGTGHHGHRNWMSLYFSRPFRELATVCGDGLARWNDPSCPERLMCERQREMTSEAAARSVCTGILEAHK